MSALPFAEDVALDTLDPAEQGPDAVLRNLEGLGGALHTRNPRVLASLAGPAVRGLVLRQGKDANATRVRARTDTHFTWTYTRDRPQLGKLVTAAHKGQWLAEDLAWGTSVDPLDPEVRLVTDAATPLAEMPAYQRMPAREQAAQRAGLMAWMLSQFLHGEQGALFAACQVTESVHWYEGKLYGATQVMDEARHVEVFQRYLDEKLGKRYQINDNLFVVLDALVRDRRWDVKFLGMQILVEGLALGAFATLRASTHEPLLRELLGRVITDEARHVHFGVVALQEAVGQLSEGERREREDWAYEMCLLLRNRFLAHEFYDEHWAHAMPRRQWDRFILESAYMANFRQTMFRRIVPNLKRVGLLPERLRGHYAAIGLLEFEHGKAAPDLTAADLL